MTADNSVPSRLRNILVIAAALVLTILVVLGSRQPSAAASLASLAEQATPYEVAIANDRPMLLEFYADWCTSCQAMAGRIAALKQDYSDRLDFVMLNIDNDKWLPEVLDYNVDGIPQFVYLNGQGQPQGISIGELPRSVLAANLDALVEAQPLPYTNARGNLSEFSADLQPSRSSQTDPRSHSGQVQDGVLD
ncbi:thiol:disulfide interchange protein TxlA [Synechococcus elongatus]|uniref:Thiol:disulfide interchange protein TxlA n=2 Tax=Synechococcus elongatus TaxID=32046 RepID=TXLA_SYNE7|nr:thioredoxin family protein [Synechococcus elongatus]P35088.1 RecName: Full=Thiol:disulfide interchange protein TxlA [Synechococcus elongatus PCC 7942 = FACHB-805]AAA89104.1 TxlA [Synechococcus elongatus PCC 7942 = FACHB-805]ABB58158.1 thioredoxin [Synechococcus elongatus PCC 7942 = FACHB-805]AJD57366.1 thiol:disulfide interchange protein [Synechococcus elongatus UTEX 2973]MBD2586877.1 thiol:disulfide interchange protein TxlA [Synechococcus elongatus FACHB-242]MBD2687948.1 thiol:disulfide i